MSASSPLRAARRGRCALPGGTPRRNAAGTGAWCSRGIRGRGRRPRRPASPRCPVGATWPARAHGVHGASVVGADVPGGPRSRWRPRGRNVAGTGAWCSRGIRGRGRRPRRPAFPMASPWASRWRPHARGAPGTSRPTRRYISFPLPFLPFPVSRNPVACDAAIVLHFIMRLRGTVYSSCPPEADAFFDLVDGTASTTALRSPRVA